MAKYAIVTAKLWSAGLQNENEENIDFCLFNKNARKGCT